MTRKDLILEIEELRNSKVICYLTADRNPINGQIAEDAVRYFYDHLLNIGNQKKIDLFLYSRGGDVSVPWRIVSMFREFCDEFSVLVPYKAHSAATLISIGADKIIMGKKAELGPIDPTLKRFGSGDPTKPPLEISVEDVNSYISFIRDRANLNDQKAVAKMISLLANNIAPLTLGNVNRQNSHIRLVARKLLTGRKEIADESKITSIIETLTEKVYFHGHGIHRNEATQIGLPVSIPKDNLEKLMWDLYLDYEKYLELLNIIDPVGTLSNQEEFKYDKLPLAVIESSQKSHIYFSTVHLKKKRKVPENFSLNLNVALPPNIDVNQLAQDAQQILQRIMNDIARNAPTIIQQQLQRASPEIGIDIKVYGGKWEEIIVEGESTNG